MTPREKKAVSLAAVAVLAFVFLQFLFLPMLGEARRLKKNIATQESQLAEMRQLAGQAGAGGSQQNTMEQALKQRASGFTLFSFLEEAAAISQVKEHIEAMQPVQTQQEGEARGNTVDVQLEQVSLSQLTHFLDLVESPQNLVAVERLTIQGGNQDGAPLNASLRVRSMDAPLDAPGGLRP